MSSSGASSDAPLRCELLRSLQLDLAFQLAQPARLLGDDGDGEALAPTPASRPAFERRAVVRCAKAVHAVGLAGRSLKNFVAFEQRLAWLQSAMPDAEPLGYLGLLDDVALDHLLEACAAEDTERPISTAEARRKEMRGLLDEAGHALMAPVTAALATCPAR